MADQSQVLDQLAEALAYSWRNQDDGTYDYKAIRQRAYRALEAYDEVVEKMPPHVAKLLGEIQQ